MFEFFKNKNTDSLASPCSGKCIDITEVNDATFADKLMGDGVAITPSDNKICSVCNGTIAMIFPTKHAFGLTTKDGLEILIHIGVDTVNLNGEGFKCYKSVGDKVKVGETIIEFDAKYLSDKNLDMTTMIILTKTEDKQFEKIAVGKEVTKGQIVMKKVGSEV